LSRNFFGEGRTGRRGPGGEGGESFPALSRPSRDPQKIVNARRGPLKVVVGDAHEQPDVVLDALFQDLQVVAAFQDRDQPALGGLPGQI
jgi:hypothetical protein